MALELIDPRSDPLHYPHHDLESYYWVLLWVVLRHTVSFILPSGDEEIQTGKQACASLFNCDDVKLGHSLKQTWVLRFDEQPSLKIADNVPLTTLVAEFQALLKMQVAAALHLVPAVFGKQLLTYTSVLEVFDRALEMPGWPDDDWIACDIGKDPRTGVAPVMSDMPTGYQEIRSDERMLRSNPLARSLTEAAIQAGRVASHGHLPTPLPLPPPSNSDGLQIASGSGLKRRRGEADQFPHPSEVPTDPKRSKTTMEPPPHPNVATAESSSHAALSSRGRRSGRIAAKKASGGGPSGKA